MLENAHLNLLVVGNGLDLALGLKTRYLDFHDYIHQNLIVKEYSNEIEKTFSISKFEFKHFRSFFHAFMSFLIEKHGPERPDFLWSNLEEDMETFFLEKENSEKDFSKGYEIFLQLLSVYYCQYIPSQIASHFSPMVDNPSLERLKVWANFCNNLWAKSPFFSIVNLNYTNFLTYKSGLHDRKIKFLPLHRDASSFVFIASNSRMTHNLQLDFTYQSTSLTDIDEEVFERGLRPDEGRRKSWSKKDRLHFQSLFSKVFTGSSLPKKPDLIHACYFGTTKEVDKSKSVISKYLSPFNFSVGYSESILEIVEERVKKSSSCTLYVFGYSFGATDEKFNNLIFKNLMTGSINKILILYFEEDLEISGGFESYKNKLLAQLSKSSEAAIPQGERKNWESVIEKKFITKNGALI